MKHFLAITFALACFSCSGQIKAKNEIGNQNRILVSFSGGVMQIKFNDKLFKIEETLPTPIWYQGRGFDTVVYFDYDHDKTSEIVVMSEDPDFGNKAYLNVYKLYNNEIRTLQFYDGKEKSESLAVTGKFCAIDSFGNVFTMGSSIINNKGNKIDIKMNKYIWDDKKGCFVYKGSKIFNERPKHMSDALF